MYKSIVSTLVLLTLISEAFANELTCTATFNGEEPVLMQNESRQGAKVLVANSHAWPNPLSARIEVNAMVEDENARVPLTAYLQEQRIVETVSGGGNELHIPVARPARRHYWFNPHEGLQVIGPAGATIAFVKCLK